jgi:hypothetical protein
MLERLQHGQVSGVNVDGNSLLGAVSYQPFGPVTGWIWGNGSQSSRAYDLAGQIKGVGALYLCLQTRLRKGLCPLLG